MKFFFILALVLKFAFSQSIKLRFKHKFPKLSDGRDHIWQEGWNASPGFLTSLKTGKGIVISTTYHSVFALDVTTGEVLWYHLFENGSGNDRLGSGVVAIQQFQTKDDSVACVGHDETKVSCYDVDTGNQLFFVRSDNIDATMDRPVQSLSAVKWDGPSSKWTLVAGISSTTREFPYANTFFLDQYGQNSMEAVPRSKTNDDCVSLGVFGKNIALGDLTGDSKPNIVIPSDEYAVCVFDSEGLPALTASDKFYNAGGLFGKVIFSRNYEHEFRGWAGSQTDLKPFFAHGHATIFEYENEKLIAVGGLYASGFDVSQENYEHSTVFVLKTNRERFTDESKGYDWKLTPDLTPRISVGNNQRGMYNMGIAAMDIYGIGEPQLIFPADDGKVHCFGLDKTEKDYWPYTVSQNGITAFASEVAIYQIGSNPPHVIFTTFAHDNNVDYNAEIVILNYNGRELLRESLPDTALSGSPNNRAVSGPHLFFHTNTTGNLLVAIQTRRAGLCLYEIENSANAVILWEGARGGNTRTGNAEKVDNFDPNFQRELSPQEKQFLVTSLVLLFSIPIFLLMFIGALGLIFIVVIVPLIKSKINSNTSNGKKNQKKKSKKKKKQKKKSNSKK